MTTAFSPGRGTPPITILRGTSMSFFLLGKGPEGDLWLLSPDSLGSRQEAMAELSRLTADPGFTHWDAEVFVMELDKGTPVLLVRPAEKPAEPVVEPEAVEEPAEPNAEPDLAEEPEPAAEPELIEELAPVEEPDLVVEPAPVEEAELVEEAHEPDPALAAVIQDLGGDEPVVTDDAVVVEADEVPVVETEESAATTIEGEGDALRDALMRTAAQMESEGIVAPESVGAADQPEVAEEPAFAVEEPAAEAPIDADEPAAAWPWDTQTSDGFALDALEEPAREATPLVTAAGDDETVAASRPVILGTYGESAPTEATVPDEVPAPSVEVDTVPTEPQGAEGPDTSDFILDLEPIGTASPAQDMTCENCVYVRTCPNKDQRDPKTCGSFQWK